MNLVDLLTKSSEFQQISDAVKPGQKQLVTGISGSGLPLLLAAMYQRHRHCQLVVVDSLFHMEDLATDLTNLVDEDHVYQFPVEEDIATEIATSSPNYRAQRVLALNALLHDEHAIVITTTAGVRRNLPAPADFQDGTLTIKTGGEVDPEKVRDQLFAMGYTRQQMVLRPGDFAIRGSIIDIYALNTDNPVRIDLFDTEVDSLRYFDASSQRSISNIEEITILPATDFLVPPEKLPAIINQLGVDRNQLLKAAGSKDDQRRDAIAGKYNQLLSALKKQQVPTELMAYTNLVYPTHHSLLDYIGKQGVVYIADWDRIKEGLKRLDDSEERWMNGQVKAYQRTDKNTLGNDVAAIFKKPTQSLVYLALLRKGMGGIKLAQLTELTSRTMQRFFGQMTLLKAELNRWHDQGQTVVLMASSPERRKQVASTLDDFHIPVVETAVNELQPHQTQLIDLSMANGFEMPAANLVVITEGEMFKQVKKRRPRHQQLANAERIKSYTDLKPGDYVVHVNHGIGLFAGIKTLEVDGVHQDYIVIDYRNHDQVFVPVTQLHLVQKYVGGSEDRHPRLNKLGGTEWAKTKRRVAAKVENIAGELVDLYAKRRLEKGYAFPKDDYLQDRFDDDFPYTETPDQNRSIKEIKQDMETAKPMDRLLVGDVGYGKTEVAMRAAFKAVTGGKQVAMLVPTTVLVQQHYDTFSARFSGFPVKIEMLSRFKTRQETKVIERDIADGKVDIVIGTHRLLSKDIHFHDLGLLIVDEEQRFGVKHKERLKQMKANVDVLTLTATPIPRTLHMSLLGVRDLSVLETPPAGRYPIQTYVMEQNAAAIRDGIMREIQRGGQVYYLHNRVSDIEKVVANLQQLVPEARVSYIHGKMTENQLESVLYDFVRGESDVLVTTSIIETGVDIPNVNTLFVENADHLGLSQLYQIRGRIGRSNRVAYAYFMYQPNKVLTEQGEKRLAAIRDFTELGSGFKIAMRDLSIRGAGNLLGKQQHGFIDSVGYDLYSDMLADAVAKKRGQKRQEKTNAEVELGVEAYLPDDYVSDQRQKIELYKDIRKASNDDDLLNIQGDMIDRFGDYCPAVDNLLKIGKLKMHADLAMLDKISRNKDQLNLQFSAEASRLLSGRQVLEQLAKTKFKATLDQGDNGQLSLRLVIQPWMKEADWIDQLQVLVSGLAKLVQGEQNEEKPTPTPGR